jgi:hypothetical protein
VSVGRAAKTTEGATLGSCGGLCPLPNPDGQVSRYCLLYRKQVLVHRILSWFSEGSDAFQFHIVLTLHSPDRNTSSINLGIIVL